MTKAELLQQIEELKQQIEALPKVEKKIRTNPLYDEHYISNSLDKNKFGIGNYFKSERDAEFTLRALHIEHAIRIRRIELNDGREPDWRDSDENKYFICTGCFGLNVGSTSISNYLPVLGYYKSEEIAEQIIYEFKDDLLWYFNEYYPEKDNMYVWGENKVVENG